MNEVIKPSAAAAYEQIALATALNIGAIYFSEEVGRLFPFIPEHSGAGHDLCDPMAHQSRDGQRTGCGEENGNSGCNPTKTVCRMLRIEGG